MLSITEEVDSINKNIEELNKKKIELLQKQKEDIVNNAKKKLTKEEAEALGLK